MGAQKEDRVKQATDVGFWLCIGICVIVFATAVGALGAAIFYFSGIWKKNLVNLEIK